MAESRIFKVPDAFELESLATSMTTWLKDNKNVAARNFPTKEGYVVQAESEEDLKKWLGMDHPIQVRFVMKSDRLIVYVGEAKWIDQNAETLLGGSVLRTLSHSLPLGNPFRTSLSEEVLDWIERYLSPRSSAVQSTSKAEFRNSKQEPLGDLHPKVRTAGRYFQKGSTFEKNLLIGHLNSGEIVLVWLAATSVKALGAKILPAAKVSWRYLLTSERSALVAFSEAAEIFFYDLLPESLDVSDKIGRDTVLAGEFMWKTELSNDRLYREIAHSSSLQSDDRLREMARLNWVNQEKDQKNGEISLWLLEALIGQTDDPLDCLGLSYIRHVIGYEGSKEKALDSSAAREELIPCLQRLMTSEDASNRLEQWVQAWQVPPAHRMALVQMILEFQPQVEAAEMALSLHRRARSSSMQEQDPLGQALADLSFAGHLLQAKHYAEAKKVLENRFAHLPDEPLLDLLPPRDMDLTQGGAQLLRCRTLELLVEARGEPDIPHAATVAELARLQPLVVERLNKLLEVASGSLYDRAENVRSLFEADGHGARGKKIESQILVHRIAEDILESHGRHPAAKSDGTLTWLESWLGQAQVPDYSALKSFVERVTPEAHPQVMDVVNKTAMALGIKKIEAYISRGDKEIGVRAYEGAPPFLLIGVAHLKSASDYYMDLPELEFAIGAEMAHLHFKHTRLTSTELWDGVFRKGTQILGVFGALSGPIGFVGDALRSLRALSSGEQALRKAEALTGGAKKAVDYVGFAKTVQQTAQTASKKEAEHEKTGIVENEDKLLAAYRLMQLTADRIGLVMCGDITAAVRALFLSTRRYRAALSVAENSGLAAALKQHDASGVLVNQDVAIRLAAMCSFYLSDGYVKLREALTFPTSHA